MSSGSNLTLSAVVGGTVASFQWQKSTDGGATLCEYQRRGQSFGRHHRPCDQRRAGHRRAGTYRLVATNTRWARPRVRSSIVVVTAGAVAPSIASKPVGSTVTVGNAYTFSVAANGTSPLAYQCRSQSTDWQRATYQPISGATNPTLALTGITLANAGLYEVTVTNIAGSATSPPETLTVVQPPSITSQPAGTTLSLGGSYTLSISAAGSPPRPSSGT